MLRKVVVLLVLVFLGSVSSKAQTGKQLIVDDDIQLISLGDSIFVHVTWHQSENFGRFTSNGLLLVRNGKALMVDTPMDNDKTERLTSYLKDSLAVELTKLVIGHYHEDCLGGLEYLQSIGIESIANYMTVEKCKTMGLPVPSIAFKDELIIDFYGQRIECRYLGAGHSPDNITVWLPAKKILFGGCLIKSSRAKGLGNLSDAVVADWDTTVKKLMGSCKDIKTVIPGHGKHGGAELLTHTIELVEKEKQVK